MPAFVYLYFRLLKNAVMMSFVIIFQNQHLRMLLMVAAPGLGGLYLMLIIPFVIPLAAGYFIYQIINYK